MKKFILKCITILTTFIVLSFLIPSLTRAESSQTIKGRVTKNDGNGIQGVDIVLTDSFGNEKSETTAKSDENGNYIINFIPNGSSYKIKFKYDNRYENPHISKKSISYDTNKACENLKLAYFASEESKTKEKIDELCEIYTGNERIYTYEKNGKIINKTTNILNGAINSVLDSFVKGMNTKRVIILDIDESLSSDDINSIYTSIKNNDYIVEYYYYVLLSKNGETEEKWEKASTHVKVYKDSETLFKEVYEYINIKTNENPKDDFKESDGEGFAISNLIEASERNVEITLKLDEKSEENPSNPGGTTNPSAPVHNPTPTSSETSTTTTGSDITGSIVDARINQKIAQKIEYKLYKKEDNNWVEKGNPINTDNGEFSFRICSN